MSRTFKTDYQALSTFDDETNNDDEHDVPPSNNVVQIRPDQSRGQFVHIVFSIKKNKYRLPVGMLKSFYLENRLMNV